MDKSEERDWMETILRDKGGEDKLKKLAEQVIEDYEIDYETKTYGKGWEEIEGENLTRGTRVNEIR